MRTRDLAKSQELPRLTWTAAEVAAQIGLSYEHTLDLIKNEMEHIRAGRNYLVPVDELTRWVQESRRKPETAA